MSKVDPRRVEEVFDRALDHAGTARAQFLQAECGGDPALREEVNALLARDERLAREPVVEGPATVGRFQVARRLGQGGMGVVYEAHDATLDRRVAVKLVRFAADRAQAARSRLLREAQAMAKVAHPNVVSVYEVGEHGDEVFIAMELVEGETLAAWLGRAARTWREVLAMYVAAGRGLAAAHAKGIVHRDFKPDNVLVGSDGRARVLDFGLAHLRGAWPSRDGAPPADAPAATESLTLTGAIMGTPSYMSPEHFGPREVDARSDQFCFAVALYRGLFAVPPFDGTTLPSLRDSVCAGRVRPPPSGETPPEVVAAILRALSPEPDARFPTMDALLAELEPPLRRDPELDPRRGRKGRQRAVAVMASFSVVTLTSVLVFESVELTPRVIVGHAVVSLLVACTLGLVFRRSFRESAHNRRLGLVFLVPCVIFLVHRLMALRLGAPAAETLVGDVLVLGAVCVLGGVMVERWLWLGAPLAAAYMVVVALAPRYAGAGFGVVVLGLLTTAAWSWGEPGTRAGKKRNDGVSGSASRSRTKE